LALLGQEKYADAEPLLRGGYHGMKKRVTAIPPQPKTRLIEAAERLVQLYKARGMIDETMQWRNELEELTRLSPPARRRSSHDRDLERKKGSNDPPIEWMPRVPTPKLRRRPEDHPCINQCAAPSPS
jgi:hypothetical protein